MQGLAWVASACLPTPCPQLVVGLQARAAALAEGARATAPQHTSEQVVADSLSATAGAHTYSRREPDSVRTAPVAPFGCTASVHAAAARDGSTAVEGAPAAAQKPSSTDAPHHWPPTSRHDTPGYTAEDATGSSTWGGPAVLHKGGSGRLKVAELKEKLRAYVRCIFSLDIHSS
jgi:hypothetical protein